MNILIDIGHPGHVHLLRNTYFKLIEDGHQVWVTTRDVPVARRLMDFYGIKYSVIGGKKKGLFSKGLSVVDQDLKMFKLVKEHKADIGLSSGIVQPHVSRVTKMKAFMFDDDDDDVEPLVTKFGHPFSDVVLTPSSIVRKTKNAIYYDGTHELAYLHPNYFVADESVLGRAGLKKGERFFIMRFVALMGHHDVNQRGLSLIQKQRLVEILEPYGRVIMTSEKKLEPEFEQYRLPVPPEDIHSLMSFATLFVGDSQTMTSEAAILGVPALKCNTFAGRLSVPNELEEKYGLCYAYQPDAFGRMCEKIEELLEQENLKEAWNIRRQRMLSDKIDVTAFFTWFIENYPESKRIMRESPMYQDRFR